MASFMRDMGIVPIRGAAKTMRIACMGLSARWGGRSVCKEEDMESGLQGLPGNKDFARLLKNSTSQKMPRNIIALVLFRPPFPSFHPLNDDAEIKQCFRILPSPQPSFYCLDVAASAEHLPPPRPKTPFAFEGFISQKFSCLSLSQRDL